MIFEEKLKYNPTFEVRKFIKDLIEMENTEEQFKMENNKNWETKSTSHKRRMENYL